jgi:hypothetical protein
LFIAGEDCICESWDMRRALLIVPLALTGCVVGTVARTAVDVATIPVKVVSAGVDAATTSQSESDEKRGRQIRKQEEEAGRQARLVEERCRKHRPLPTDQCSLAQQR